MIAGYIQINLAGLLDELGEDRTKSILSDFSCPLNKDVESFLTDKAIEFSKQGISATHLVFASLKNKPVLVGYFTLASKFITIYKKNISNSLRKRVRKFAQDDVVLKRYIMSTPLIAQLGKNYKNGYDDLISGDELLKMACEKVRDIQANLGGRFVYLECEDKQRLIDFYDSNGFVNFGKRPLDKDEESVMNGNYLVQMLKYLKPST